MKCREIGALLATWPIQWAFLTLGLFPEMSSGQGIITTVAGTEWVFQGNGRLAVEAPLGDLQGVAIDKDGNVFFSDSGNYIVGRINPDGTVTVVAGNGIRAVSQDGPGAVNRPLFEPGAITFDPSGNLYIVDGKRVRKLLPNGSIVTVAGGGASRAEGIAAIQAALFPSGIAADGSGGVYISECGFNRVVKVSADGSIRTIAGTGTAGFSGDGGPAIQATFNCPRGLALENDRALYIGDYVNYRVRRVNLQDGRISTAAGAGREGDRREGAAAAVSYLNQPLAVALDRSGDLYIAEQSQRIRRLRNGVVTTVAGGSFGFSGDGGPAIAAGLAFLSEIAVDQAGGLYICDSGNLRLRKVVQGTISTIAGNEGWRLFSSTLPAKSAWLTSPTGLAFDGSGNLFIADQYRSGRIRKVDPAGRLETIAGAPYAGTDLGNPRQVQLAEPQQIATSADNNLYIAGKTNRCTIWRIGSGRIAVFAGSTACGYSGDGGLATQATLFLPEGVAVDSSGIVYIADTGNHVIRRVTRDGRISTVAGRGGQSGYAGDRGPATSALLNRPAHLAFDPSGSLLISDKGNHCIRRILADGMIETIAGTGTAGYSGDGGPAQTARLSNPVGIISDRAGNIYIADSGNHCIRRIGLDRTISTVVGNGFSGFAGDGGLGRDALLSAPFGVALDGLGNLYIADRDNNRVRQVLAAPPNFQISTDSLQVQARGGGRPPEGRTIDITSTVTGLAYSASVRTSDGRDWLRATPSNGGVPARLTVSADTSGLPSGQYEGSVTVTSAGANPPSRTVIVALTVTESQPPNIGVTTDRIVFPFVQGAEASSTELAVTNQGSGLLNVSVDFSTATGGEWLSVMPGSGSATGTEPLPVSVTADPGRLDPGTYTGLVTISATTSDQPTLIPVTMTITAVPRSILLSERGLTFTTVARGGTPLPRNFGILNMGNAPMNWAARATTLSGGDWLRITPASGSSSPRASDAPLVEVSANGFSLEPGNYSGQITITAAGAVNSPQTVTVELIVLPPGSRPAPEIRPSALTFIGEEGRDPESQNIFIANWEGSAASFSSLASGEGGRPWFVHLPTDATVLPNHPARIVVQPNFENLTTGVRRGTLSFLFDNGAVETVSLLAVVSPSEQTAAKNGLRFAGCTPARLLPQFSSHQSGFTITAGQAVNLAARVVDDCGTVMTQGSVAVRFSNTDPETTLVHTQNGNWGGTWQPRDMSQAQMRMALTAIGVVGPRRIGGETIISGVIRAGGLSPVLRAGSVVNAASLTGQAIVAPGTLISVFGERLAEMVGVSETIPLRRELGGAEVVLGGQTLPLLYASEQQVNAQVPYPLTVDTQHDLLVRRGTSLSIPTKIVVASAHPAVFTRDLTGSGQGAIIRGDRLAEPGNAGAAGEIIVVYCAGLGAVSPETEAGSAAPGTTPARVVNPVTVTIGGRLAQVLFAGLAPGFAGVYQINVIVPEGVTPGNEVPLIVTQAGQSSPVVTLALR